MLVAITDREKSKEAFGLLCSTLTNGRGLKRFNCYVSTKTKSSRREYEVTWHPDKGIWVLLQSHSTSRRTYFWCCYGLEYPKDRAILTPTLEINPPHEGIDLRRGGMFVRDAKDNIYLCHTGRIGGGKKGIGKTVFWDRYTGASIDVNIGRPNPVQAVNLGQVNSPKLPNRIARLVREVKRIKNISPAASSVPDKFTPEFSGQKSSYSLKGTIEATPDHGFVVDELRRAVEIAGHKPFNDQQRDLFVTGRNGRMGTLFEVKTDVSTTSIYQAVGQLMLNGSAQQPKVKKILVVPQKPTKETEQALKKLCINVLTYNWKQNKPVIPSLDGLLP